MDGPAASAAERRRYRRRLLREHYDGAGPLPGETAAAPVEVEAAPRSYPASIPRHVLLQLRHVLRLMPRAESICGQPERVASAPLENGTAGVPRQPRETQRPDALPPPGCKVVVDAKASVASAPDLVDDNAKERQPVLTECPDACRRLTLLEQCKNQCQPSAYRRSTKSAKMYDAFDKLAEDTSVAGIHCCMVTECGHELIWKRRQPGDDCVACCRAPNMMLWCGSCEEAWCLFCSYGHHVQQ